MLDNQHGNHILIVDSDTNTAELLQFNLSSEGYGVTVVGRASEALPMLPGDFVLVIVDSMDEQYTGLDLVDDAKSRPETAFIPFIVYSAYRGERDVINALDAGADDYMQKPISLLEMVARVKAVLRRRPARPAAPAAPVRDNSQITIGRLSIDMHRRIARIDGANVVLTPTEFAILALLAQHRESYVSRLDIHRAVWPESAADGNERKVDTNISRLRKKLGPVSSYVVNRSGLGYTISDNN